MSQLKNNLILVIFVFGCVFVLTGSSVSTIFISKSSTEMVSNPLSSNSFKLSKSRNTYSQQDFVPFTATNNTGRIFINGNSQIAAYASSGNGSATNPYVLQNFNISSSFLTSITIINTDDHVIIKNCYINNQNGFFSMGINVTNDLNLIINNNQIVNPWNGISILDSSTGINNEITVVVSNNSISHTRYALTISNSNRVHVEQNSITNSVDAPISISSSTNLVVNDNYCVNFNNALSFYQTSWSSIKNNFLSANGALLVVLDVESSNHNTFVNNTLQKASTLLKLYQSNWNVFSNMTFKLGIIDPYNPNNATYIDSSNYNTVTNSTFDSSFSYDISITSGRSNQITENTFSNAQEFNLLISTGSESNVVEKNAFLNLGNYGNTQAYDNGFIDLFLYNFWKGWTGPDNDSNGIVDTPYLIDGLAHSYDTKPLATVSEIGVLGSTLIVTSSNTNSIHTSSSTNTNTNTSTSTTTNFFSSTNTPMIAGIAGLSLIIGLVIPIVLRKIRR